MATTKEEFKDRVHQWAEKLDVPVHTISMRTMRNKWASYTPKSGLLIFNIELLEMDDDVCDYVIVHELLHSRVPNHGKLWKSMMTAYLGDYEGVEKKLWINIIIKK
jgi:predicted metal-dependent hydrolase